jgi:hypothetical protein
VIDCALAFNASQDLALPPRQAAQFLLERSGKSFGANLRDDATERESIEEVSCSNLRPINLPSNISVVGISVSQVSRFA